MTSWADVDLRQPEAPLWPPAPSPAVAWGPDSVPVQPRETPTSEPDARPPAPVQTVWVAAVLQTVVSQKVNRLGGQLPAGGGGRSAIAGMFSNQVETFETTSLHVVAVELTEQAVREAYQNWPSRREGDELFVVEKPVGAGAGLGEVTEPAPVSATYPCIRCHERMLTVGSYCPPCREEYLAECRALDPDPGRE